MDNALHSYYNERIKTRFQYQSGIINVSVSVLRTVGVVNSMYHWEIVFSNSIEIELLKEREWNVNILFGISLSQHTTFAKLNWSALHENVVDSDKQKYVCETKRVRWYKWEKRKKDF